MENIRLHGQIKEEIEKLMLLSEGYVASNAAAHTIEKGLLKLSLTLFFYGCEKELKGTEQTLEDSSERMKKVVLSPYNQKLLDDFLANTKQYLKSSDLSSRTAYSMMQFTDEGGYNSYNLALDNLSDQWDNTNGQPIPAGDDFLILDNPGNPAFNAVDYSLSFQSTRYDYDYNSQFNRNWNTSDPQITDYYFLRVMNLNEEVQIGGYIYKQLADGFIAKIDASDAVALQEVRLKGRYANVDMEILDEDFGTVGKRLATRGACNFTIAAKQNPNNTIVEAAGGEILIPSTFGISESLSETAFGRITFGSVVYSKDFWHWDN